MSRPLPSGTGFFIWQLEVCLPVSRMIQALHQAGATWVSIKVANGANRVNQITADGKQSRDDVFLLSVIRDLKADGFHVGGWHFVFPLPTVIPGAQSGVAGERFEKLDLDSWLIDGEQVSSVGAFWSTLADGTANPQRNYSASQYMDALKANGLPESAPVALTSYRFPKLFPLFPFKQFVRARPSGSNDFIAQQMYWLGSHNPGEQLEESIKQYKELVRADIPFVPMGAAWGQDVNGKYWEPTVQDLQEFIAKAKELGCPAWGFWKLESAIKRPEWLDAIRGDAAPPPQPPPPTIPKKVTINTSVLNIRNAPIISTATMIGTTSLGKVWEVTGSVTDEQGRIWYQSGPTVHLAGWLCKAVG